MRPETELSWPWRYGVAVVATGLMLLAGLLMSRWMNGAAPLSLFILPVLVSARYCGLGSGLLATLLGALLGKYFFVAPLLSWGISEPVDWARLGIFLVAGTAVSWLAASLHQARNRAENAARRAEQRQEELERQIAELARVEAERQGLFEQLATERARFQAVVENMPAGIVVAEPSGRVVMFNPQAEKVLGHPVIPTPDLEGYEKWPAYHPDGRPYERHEYTMVRALQGEVVRDREFLYRQSDGTMRWRRASATPIHGPGGEIQGAISLVYDIDAEKQAEETRLRDQERLNLAQKAARIGHFEWKIQTDENLWSEELEALYGLPPGGFEGKYQSWARRVHPEDLPRAEEALSQALVDGEFLSEWRAVWPDGSLRWIEARASIFFDDAGRPVRMIGINMDVTERKRAEEALRASELRLDLALTAARMGIWHLDLATLNLTCSASCKANFGRTPDRPFTYDDLREAILPEDRPGFQEAVRRAVETGDEYQAEYRVVWPDGSIHWITARGRVTCGDDGRPVAMDGVTVDLTERRRMEESLRLQAEALQEADRRKDEFLAILAHELRNPLAPIHNSLQILALCADDPAAVEKARELMERQVQQMIRMVDDLLEVSRIARGKVGLRKEMVDLAGVVATAVETSRPGIETRRHELTVELPERPIYVEGDPARLAQVLTNLLNNAAKYTEVGGRIGLRVERNGREGGEAVLRVRDNGIGIAPEMLPRVFDMFAQAESGMERAQGGLGVGLTLVRRLIEMHGGTVEAASDGLGKGSELVVRLPALEETAAAGQPSAELLEEEAAEPSRRVLVVDDNVDSAESLALLLQLYGHQARLAHDGVTGLEEARSFLPDVVLLDIGLPRLDGYSVAKRLRQEPGLDNVTLIAMTGYGQEEDRRRSRDAGFDHHLVKPVDLDTLRGLLASPPG